MDDQTHAFGPFIYDLRRKRLTRNGMAVNVGQRALAILEVLLEAQGKAVSKSALMEAVWQTENIEESNLTVQIAALRKALGSAPSGEEWISTVQRVGYRFTGPAQAKRPSLHYGSTVTPIVPSGKPSIAVLPFNNLSGDSAQDYLADGLTEDIVAALSRVREFFVISRTTSFYYKGRTIPATDVAKELAVRYILEGSVRVAGPRVRVSAQLVDGSTGHSVWAEKYDGELGDIFAVQDEITRNIALAMQVKLTYGELALLWEGQTKNLRAWEKMAQGRDLFLKFNPISNREAQRALREAIEIDPRYTGAMVHLGLCHWWQARYDDSVDKDLSLSLCESQIERALAINPSIGAAYMLKGGNAFLRDRHEEAIAECEKAIALAPSDSWASAFLGLVATYGGKPARAVEVLKIALRLSPHPPNWYIESFATANLWHGDMATATKAAEENYRLEPDDPDAHLVLGSIYGLQGRIAEAAEVVADWLRKHPHYTTKNVMRTERYAIPSWQEQVVNVLRAAGLPD